MQRYIRQSILPEVSLKGQLKLKDAKILIVGVGGLGCPASLYLAAAGVGKIGLVDFDAVDLSNLQRQVLFLESDLNQNKAIVAANHLKQHNSEIIIETYPLKLTSDNIIKICSEYDLILDCTDNFATKYLLNDATVVLNKPLVSASILGFTGTLAIFNGGATTASMRCLFPEPPEESLNCAENGVLGSTAGTLGVMQAGMALNYIIGIYVPINTLTIFNLKTFQTQQICFSKNYEIVKKTEIFEQAVYDQYLKGCKKMIKEIEPQELKNKFENQQNFYLLDVREQFEKDLADLGGQLISVRELAQKLDQLPREQEIVVYCKAGVRGAKAVEILLQNGFKNVCNLAGGILRYAQEIDSNIKQY